MSGSRSEDKKFHALVRGLIQYLPGEEQEEWPIYEQEKVLRAAASIFALLYPDRAGRYIAIRIEPNNQTQICIEPENQTQKEI